MKKLNREVRDFMGNQLVYDNPHNVEITSDDDNDICIASGWPGVTIDDAFNLEVFFECNSVAEFIRVFGIQSVEDLDRITPAFLLNLYQQGKADICCAVDTVALHHPLRFRKQNNAILAIEDNGLEHAVPVLLETPQQFMDYTQQHSLTAVNNNRKANR